MAVATFPAENDAFSCQIAVQSVTQIKATAEYHRLLRTANLTAVRPGKKASFSVHLTVYGSFHRSPALGTAFWHVMFVDRQILQMRTI